MPPKAPTSPTQLLWAHQLKREHGFLLDRVKNLETEIKRVDTSTKAAAAAASEKVAALSKKVQAPVQEDGSKALDKLKAEVLENFEDVLAKIEAITNQVTRMDDQKEKEKQLKKMAVQNENALLERIDVIEEGFREYKARYEEMGLKADEDTVDIIRESISRIAQDIKNNRFDVAKMNEQWETLRQTVEYLKEANEALEREMREQAARAAPLPAPTAGLGQARGLRFEAPENDRTGTPVIDERADRTAEPADSPITQRRGNLGHAKPAPAVGEAEHQRPQRRTAAAKKAATQIKKEVVEATQAATRTTRKGAAQAKSQAQHAEGAATNVRLTRARAAEGGPTDDTQAPEPRVRPTKAGKRMAAETQAPKTQASRPTKAPKRKAQAVETQGPEDNENGRPVRAAKLKAVEALESQFPTRIKKEPKTQTQAPAPKKRKVAIKKEPKPEPEPAPIKAKEARKIVAAAKAAPPKGNKMRRGLTNIFSSPMSSSEDEEELELPELPPNAMQMQMEPEREGDRVQFPDLTSSDSENARALAPYL